MTNSIITFYIVSLFLVISPGPNMALIIDNATRLGKSNALANVAGLCTATFAHGALSILGVSAIVLNNETLFLVVKIIGAAYLLYLGLKSIRSGWKSVQFGSTLVFNTDPSTKVSNTKLSRSYVDGLVTQILNPKVSIFYIAAFPKFLADGISLKGGFGLVAIHSFNIFSWFTLLIIFISFFSVAMQNPKVRGYINISTGLVLALFAAFILFD